MEETKTYEVEVIHEPSGVHMMFVTDLEGDHINDDNAWEFIMDELSIICNRME